MSLLDIGGGFPGSEDVKLKFEEVIFTCALSVLFLFFCSFSKSINHLSYGLVFLRYWIFYLRYTSLKISLFDTTGRTFIYFCSENKMEYFSTTARAIICQLGGKIKIVVQVKFSLWILLG